MKSLKEMTLDELKEYLQEMIELAEGYRSCQDGSYEMCWHYRVRPVEEEIERRKNK